MQKHTPREKTVFWCSICDNERVDSTIPETGSFYTQAGHLFNPSSNLYDGEYSMVMFAICSDCEYYPAKPKNKGN